SWPRLIGDKEAFILHRPRPPQTPAPSFKSPYRKCPGDPRSGSAQVFCAATSPIKANDFRDKWISFALPVTVGLCTIGCPRSNHGRATRNTLLCEKLRVAMAERNKSNEIFHPPHHGTAGIAKRTTSP